jgi:hypothetical protein
VGAGDMWGHTRCTVCVFAPLFHARWLLNNASAGYGMVGDTSLLVIHQPSLPARTHPSRPMPHPRPDFYLCARATFWHEPPPLNSPLHGCCVVLRVVCCIALRGELRRLKVGNQNGGTPLPETRTLRVWD